jgi:hypothetical protein
MMRCWSRMISFNLAPRTESCRAVSVRSDATWFRTCSTSLGLTHPAIPARAASVSERQQVGVTSAP